MQTVEGSATLIINSVSVCVENMMFKQELIEVIELFIHAKKSTSVVTRAILNM